jgi:hypothetical protein
MIDDPLHTLSVSLPPGWTFDPTRSSLTSLAFVDWRSPESQQAFVEIATPRVGPGASDDEWQPKFDTFRPFGQVRLNPDKHLGKV